MSVLTLANGQKFDTSLNTLEVIEKSVKSKIRGVVLYEGPSVLDNSPIVVIATLNTSNVKTGNMVQTWILRADMNPLDASKQGLDHAICGRCPHRRNLGGACYVTLHQAPRAIYEAYKRVCTLKFHQLTKICYMVVLYV